jgi:hypothetical protein
MRSIRLLVVGSAAVVSLAGIGIATAGSGTSSSVGLTATQAKVITQLRALEVRAAGNPTALAALQRAETAVVAQRADNGQAKGKPTSPPPPCPPNSPNAGGVQPCGVVAHIICPTHSPNAGNHPPCGRPSPKPTTTTAPPAAACGPADAGGTPATGPISGILYGIGLQISNGGGAPLGDAVQSIACAVFVNLGL